MKALQLGDGALDLSQSRLRGVADFAAGRRTRASRPEKAAELRKRETKGQAGLDQLHARDGFGVGVGVACGAGA